MKATRPCESHGHRSSPFLSIYSLSRPLLLSLSLSLSGLLAVFTTVDTDTDNYQPKTSTAEPSLTLSALHFPITEANRKRLHLLLVKTRNLGRCAFSRLTVKQFQSQVGRFSAAFTSLTLLCSVVARVVTVLYCCSVVQFFFCVAL